MEPPLRVPSVDPFEVTSDDDFIFYLKQGAEALRAGGYEPSDWVTEEMMRGFDVEQLICRSARVATSHGVYVCPILLDSPDAKLGDTLEEGVSRPYALRHQACTTCYMHGAICANPSLGLAATAG